MTRQTLGIGNVDEMLVLSPVRCHCERHLTQHLGRLAMPWQKNYHIRRFFSPFVCLIWQLLRHVLLRWPTGEVTSLKVKEEWCSWCYQVGQWSWSISPPSWSPMYIVQVMQDSKLSGSNELSAGVYDSMITQWHSDRLKRQNDLVSTCPSCRIQNTVAKMSVIVCLFWTDGFSMGGD